tara:strand:+ start:409 stop:588 length:180 start_codon:yes stop_codon:yes gene_type:complete
MTMMVVTVVQVLMVVLMVVQQAAQQVVQSHAMIVNLIGVHTVLSAVIQHGMNLVLTVLL